MSRPFQSRAASLGICLAVSILYLIFDTHVSHAGEIHGHVTSKGKVLPDAQVAIKCPSFSKTTKTNTKGKYRLRPGPSGEEKCTVSVNNSNSVTFYTSKGRTSVKLAIVNNRLQKK